MKINVLYSKEELHIDAKRESNTLQCAIFACINREFALKKVFREKYKFRINKNLLRNDLYITSRKVINSTCAINDILEKCSVPTVSLPAVHRYTMSLFTFHSNCFECVKYLVRERNLYADKHIVLDGKVYSLTEALDILEQYEYNE